MRGFSLIFIILLISCNDSLNTWEGYIISRGDHYSHKSGLPPRLVSLFDGRHLLFDANFFSNCIYVPQDSSINKLYGFTDCNSAVHENSVRFGWRINKEKIDIFAYWYLDSDFHYHYLGSTRADVTDHYEIWAKQDEYYFKFNDVVFVTHRSKKCVHGIRERLFPYFGGDHTAPHTMQIEIDEYE